MSVLSQLCLINNYQSTHFYYKDVMTSLTFIIHHTLSKRNMIVRIFQEESSPIIMHSLWLIFCVFSSVK